MKRAGTLVVFALVVGIVGGVAPRQAPAQDVERGRDLFGLCSSCHGPSGAGNAMFLAPNIAGLDVWYVKAQLEKFRGGIRGRHFDDLAGMRMRPMSLVLRTAEDVESVAGFVTSLPPTNATPTLEGGDPAAGATLYQQVCATCHGASAEGNRQAVPQPAPPLARQSDWYMLTQIQNFKAGIRGSDPRDAGGAAMRPMSYTLPDEQTVKNVIAYIKSLAE